MHQTDKNPTMKADRAQEKWQGKTVPVRRGLPSIRWNGENGLNTGPSHEPPDGRNFALRCPQPLARTRG